MPSLFAELETRVSAEVDRVYAERTSIRPRVKTQHFGSVADADKQQIEVLGVVDFNPVVAQPRDLGQYDGFQPKLTGDRIIVSYTATLFTPETMPKDGYEIVLVERNDKVLSISRVEPDGLGRVVCVCTP